MLTIKEASARTGIPVQSLRAWERRYGIGAPQRSEAGYRLYDEQAISVLTTMRRLVDGGWTPANAATAIMRGQVPLTTAGRTPTPSSSPGRLAGGPTLTEAFVDAASAVDAVGVEAVLDQAFGLATFETVVDDWLMPTLRTLGEAWADGSVDVAGEHAASYAVVRRLSQAFSAAASTTRGPRVVVGLPAGSHHEFGALAFATAARRRGLAVVYVGADLPLDSWTRAVRAFPTGVAVMGVPTIDDAAAAAETARALTAGSPDVLVAAGGLGAADLSPDVLVLPPSIDEAAALVESRLAV
jgi:methylmalonyl-CoA mutase cobalamin-binding subunit